MSSPPVVWRETHETRHVADQGLSKWTLNQITFRCRQSFSFTLRSDGWLLTVPYFLSFQAHLTAVQQKLSGPVEMGGMVICFFTLLVSTVRHAS